MTEGKEKRTLVVSALWGLIASVSIGAVVSFIWTAFFWDQFIEFSNKWGNVVSVAGVWIGLIAFLLTIFSLLITHQAEKEARDRIKQALANASDAVKTAQEETREAVARIGFELLQSECAALNFTIREINRLVAEAVTRGEYWVRVADRCREVAHAANLLLANPHLNEEEVSGLRRRSNDLNSIARFVERNRIPPRSTQAPLRPAQVEPLEAMLTLITNISARIRRRVLEVPHANI